MKKLIRITTVPISLEKLLENQLRFMEKYYSVTAVASDKENLERVGRLQEVNVHHIEMTRKITPFKDLKAVWELFLFFRKEKPFIVHTHTPKAGTVGMLAAKLANVPNRLHTVAGLPLLEATGNKRKLLNFVEKLTYSCATKIYPNSYGLKDIIVKQRFCKPHKLKVIGNGSSNGIDTSYFNLSNILEEITQELKNNLGIAATDFVFIFVGRLVADKGINELINAFQKINKSFEDVKLLLVGSLETDLDPLKEETLTEINHNKNIISVGYQKDVRPYFAISNALVFPSYREGFPNVVMQAGAMRLPCIVTDINGCNEIISNQENGIIIPPKNSIRLQNAMELFINDINKTNTMATKSRSMIVNRYEQKLVWEAILTEYKSLENV